MKRKPWSLVILALLHILAPLGNFLFNALRAKRSFAEQWFYWTHIIPPYLLFVYVVVPVLAGVLIFICRRWSYWAYLGLIALVLASNIYSFWTSMNMTSFIVLISILVIDILVVAYFVVPSVQQVYFDPRLRWWEAAPRYHFDQEGTVDGRPVILKNIGAGGLFLSSSEDLLENSLVKIFWKRNDKEVSASGRIVYKNLQGTNPGYGIRFENLPPTSQQQISAQITVLHEQGKIVAERLPGPEDGFGIWFKKLITTGEGLFPKTRR